MTAAATAANQQQLLSQGLCLVASLHGASNGAAERWLRVGEQADLLPLKMHLLVLLLLAQVQQFRAPQLLQAPADALR
jgi:hypothetical protein